MSQLDENSLPAEAPGKKLLEVPMRGSDELVTVDLDEDLPDDCTELISFLENEEAAVKYWLTIAGAYSDKNLTAQAFETIQKGLESHSRKSDNRTIASFHTFSAWLYLRLARTAKTSEEKAQALRSASESARAVLNIDSSSVLNRLAQAEIFYLEKNYDQALDLYERISKNCKNPELEVYALIGKAKILFKKGNFTASLKQFQTVLLFNPSIKPDPRIAIGLNFWRLKDKKLAIKSWERALQLDSANKSAKLLLTLGKFDSSFNSLSDDAFIESYSSALDSLQSLLKEDSSNPVSLLLLASYYYSQGDYDSVLKITDKVLANPSSPSNIISDAYFWIARVNYHNGDYTQSQKYFVESLKANPDNLLSKLGVGQSQSRRELKEEAILTFEGIYKVTQKVLEVDYILGILYSENPKTHEKAIEALQKYIRGSQENSEPIILNAYLTLSMLFENKDNVQALNYLSKAIDSLHSKGERIPIEILNNLGVFHFVRGNPESAQTFFKSAIESNKSDETGISLLYNIARAEENSNPQDAVAKYNQIVDKAPNYIYSKIRLLYLEILKADLKNDIELEQKMKKLLEAHPNNLEIRAFFSWYLKRTNKVSNQNLESSHNKETLVKHDSHDTYALISLGNLYCTIAREIRGKTPQDIEKRNQSYIRGAQLFEKVLTIDPYNIFAAQGIAIIFTENKQNAIALETFRKIRDAIDDVSIYINLGHCLIDVGQYSKAIETYEIALRRYGDENKDSRYLTLVGRAWFARAVSEKSLESYLKSLEYSVKSYDVSIKNGFKKLAPSLKYNVAFVKFNIAQFVQKLDLSKRTVEDIKTSITYLKEAIEDFNSLAQEKYPPISPEILQQRASMGSNTIINQLERALKEQEEYEVEYEHKIKDAQRLRDEERAQNAAEETKRREFEENKKTELREDYLKLQGQAQEWEKERESLVVFEEDEKKSKKGKKKNAIVTDDELSEDEDGEIKVKKTVKRTKKSKRKTEIGNDEDENEEDSKETKKRKIESKFKSAEFIEDSDSDEDIDFDESKLGGENEDDDILEKAEAQLENAENQEKENDEDEEDPDLF